MPARVADFELTAPDRWHVDLAGYRGLRLLVRCHGRPLGWLDFAADPPPDADRIVAHARRRFAVELAELALARTLAPPSGPGALPSLTVVVCTRDRAERLERCLSALLAAGHPAREIVVVDNASRDDATARLCAGLPVRYVREDRPGLDWARNAGIAAARHEVVAFTDDDVRVDPGWARAIAAPFADPGIMAVTGPIAPAELETPAQALFELGYGGMVQGLRGRTIRRGETYTWDLLWAGSYGAGANMAFRRELFDRIGPFDPALDVGTPSGGGGDLEMLLRVVAGGHALRYEPDALVWHEHRRDPAALRRQLFDNGRGFGAYLLTALRRRTLGRGAVLHFMLRAWLAGWLLRRLVRPRGFPRSLVRAELAGGLLSPFCYVASRRQARRVAARHPRSA